MPVFTFISSVFLTTILTFKCILAQILLYMINALVAVCQLVLKENQ